MKIGEKTYERISDFVFCISVIVVTFLVHSWSGVIYNYFFPVEEIERELGRAEKNNKEAREITTEVTEGLGKTSIRLASTSDRLGSVSERLGSVSERLGSVSDGVTGITERIGNIQIEAKKTGRDLGRAESLIEESLCILEKVEKEGESR